MMQPCMGVFPLSYIHFFFLECNFFQIYEGVDMMEKCSCIGLVSIATVDLMFCAFTFCDSLHLKDEIIYTSRDASYFFTVYGTYFQNVLIKVSIWCTVIIAASRYMIVCYPLKARILMKPFHTVIAVFISTAIWSALHIPLLWIWQSTETYCSHGRSVIVLALGYYMNEDTFRRNNLIAWFCLGFIIPVVILIYSNVGLIISLEKSRRLQQNTRDNGNRFRDQHRRISLTLIAVVVMFFVCVCPGEILAFYSDMSLGEASGHTFSLLVVICNMFQALNFSGNFALYCAVNVYFRRDLWRLFSCRGRVQHVGSRRTSSLTTSITSKKQSGHLSVRMLSSLNTTEI